MPWPYFIAITYGSNHVLNLESSEGFLMNPSYSWKRPDGAIQLMGGFKRSGYTSEVVTPSGSVDGFRMKDYTL